MAYFTPKHNLAKRIKYMVLAALPILFILSGCASYGKLSLPPKDEAGALLADLLSQTDRYVVHYHGNSKKFVSGVLFDLKDDAKTIRPEGALWNEVSDPDTIAATIDIIQRGDHPGYFPRLYSIIAPDGDFYGYLFTGWNYLAIRTVDEQTLRVYGLKGPPEYEDYSGSR